VYAVNGGLERARELLKRSHGGDADSILDRIVAASAQTPFNFLRARRADQVVSLLSNEHPQIIALVLSHLPLGLAARVLEGLHDKTRADVATRYAMLDGADPEVVSEIEALLARRAGTSETTNTEARGGVKPLAQLLNSVARETEKGVLAEIERTDPTLAAEVRELMFVFDDLIHMDDRSLQEILRACDTRMIAMALKGAADDVRTKMEGNLSKRASEDIAELSGAMSNAKKTDIEKAQSEIVKVARKLEESGAIVLVRGETTE
jgi:flagellar motor switch protein FliG